VLHIKIHGKFQRFFSILKIQRSILKMFCKWEGGMCRLHHLDLSLLRLSKIGAWHLTRNISGGELE
jgi:hypothetical protein